MLPSTARQTEFNAVFSAQFHTESSTEARKTPRLPLSPAGPGSPHARPQPRRRAAAPSPGPSSVTEPLCPGRPHSRLPLPCGHRRPGLNPGRRTPGGPRAGTPRSPTREQRTRGLPSPQAAGCPRTHHRYRDPPFGELPGARRARQRQQRQQPQRDGPRPPPLPAPRRRRHPAARRPWPRLFRSPRATQLRGAARAEPLLGWARVSPPRHPAGSLGDRLQRRAAAGRPGPARRRDGGGRAGGSQVTPPGNGFSTRLPSLPAVPGGLRTEVDSGGGPGRKDGPEPAGVGTGLRPPGRCFPRAHGRVQREGGLHCWDGWSP